MIVFAFGSADALLYPILEPWIAGSHAVVYTDAARAWLTGGDPWSVGPPAVVFAGPPTMLVPFIPFVVLPELVTRVAWIAGMAAVAIWSLRRLALPAYWLAFPPLFSAIVLGHPEVLVLALVLVHRPWAGLATIIKPYAGLPLLAERRWPAIALAALVGLGTLLVLPWPRFLAELPQITANLARQDQGDAVFGDPLLMAVAVVALASIGLRRALWLAAPLLWPHAQPIYKTMTIPMLSPIVAIAWALPIHGATLAGVVVAAAIEAAGRRWRLPDWLRAGIEIRASMPVTANETGPAPALAQASVGKA